jgi:hypothetical protein
MPETNLREIRGTADYAGLQESHQFTEDKETGTTDQLNRMGLPCWLIRLTMLLKSNSFLFLLAFFSYRRQE